MKRFIVVFCCIMLALTSANLFAQGAAENTTAEAKEVELKIWARSDDIAYWIPGFEAENPGVKVTYTVIPDQEMTQKLITVIASKKGVPDMFQQEYVYIPYLVNAGVFADLADFGMDEYMDKVWPSSLAAGTDDEGKVRALTWQACPGSIIYRRDMAEKYLGTGDPAEVAKLLDTDEKMLDLAAKLKADGIRMFGAIKDIFDIKSSSRTYPWVVDGKLVIDDEMYAMMEMTKVVMQNGYDLGVDQWAPEWLAAVDGDNLFCYVLPSWGYQFVVKPNAKATSGKWAICQPPAPYINGGTYTGIYKDSPNKELAWEFLKYVCLNEETQYAYATEKSDYMALKSVDLRLEKESTGEEVLAGQNPFAIYNEEMNTEFRDLQTDYDSQLMYSFISAAKAYGNGATLEEAINQFKADVKNSFPEIIVE